MKNKKTLFSRCMLDFSKREFAIVVATTLEKAERRFRKQTGIEMNLSPQDFASTALCVTMDSGAVVLLFAYEHLCASLICHEVTHATHGIFDRIGVTLCRNSDEAFAYHNDMLFRKVASLLREHKVSIPLLPADL